MRAVAALKSSGLVAMESLMTTQNPRGIAVCPLLGHNKFFYLITNGITPDSPATLSLLFGYDDWTTSRLAFKTASAHACSAVRTQF